MDYPFLASLKTRDSERKGVQKITFSCCHSCNIDKKKKWLLLKQFRRGSINDYLLPWVFPKLVVLPDATLMLWVSHQVIPKENNRKTEKPQICH